MVTGNRTRGAFIALLAFVGPGVSAQPTTQAQISTVIASGFATLNSADMRSYEALWEPNPILIDDMPPYLWSGEGVGSRAGRVDPKEPCGGYDVQPQKNASGRGHQ